MFEKRLKSVSNRFKEKVGGSLGAGFDWTALIGIFAQLLPVLLANCQKTPASSDVKPFAQRLKNPGLLEHVALRRAVRDELDAEDDLTRRALRRKKVQEMCDACWEEAADATEADIDAFVQEAVAGHVSVR